MYGRLGIGSGGAVSTCGFQGVAFANVTVTTGYRTIGISAGRIGTTNVGIGSDKLRLPRGTTARQRRAVASPAEIRVGLLSDTHGLLRSEVQSFLTGCDYIIHGGDIGDAGILDQLSLLAPLIVVRGNNDNEPWGQALCDSELIRIGGVFVYVIHDLTKMNSTALDHNVRVVISGHSHKPTVQERDGVLYVNPGSCGPRRFKLPISVAELRVSGDFVTAKTVELHG